MQRNDFIIQVSKSLKLIRAEKNLTQEKMSDILGISKKTLIEIEKSKIPASWAVCVSAAVIFEDTMVVEQILGGDVNESIRSLSNTNNQRFTRTLGGKIWWENVSASKSGEYRLQKNLISGHFRILDAFDRRIASSFNEDEIKAKFKRLSTEFNQGEQKGE